MIERECGNITALFKPSSLFSTEQGEKEALPFSNNLQFPYPLFDLQRVKLTSFKAAPQKKAEGGGSQATKAPLPSSVEPAFVGKTVTEVAAWLRNKPDKVLLEGKFFGVLDKRASGGKDGKENKVVLCRIGDKDGQGDKVQCVLMSAEESTLTLGGMEYGNFDGLIEGKGEYVPEI